MGGEQPTRARSRAPSRAETIEESLLKNAPWMPAPFELADAYAIKQLAQGKATPDEQRRALHWIQAVACGLPDWAYRPGATDRDTNIALGRQFVGHQIQRLIAVPIGQLKRKEPNADEHDPTAGQ